MARLVSSVLFVMFAVALAVVSSVVLGSRAAQPTAPTVNEVLVVTTLPNDEGAVHVVQLATGAVRGSVRTGPDPAAEWSADGSNILVRYARREDSRLHEVLLLDAASLSERARLTLRNVQLTRPPGLRAVTMPPGGSVVVAAERGSGHGGADVRVAGYELSTGKALGSVALAACGPASLENGPEAGSVWVTCFGSSQLVHVDTSAWRSLRVFQLPSSGRLGVNAVVAATVSPKKDRYVAVTRDLTLVSVDLRSGASSTDTRWRQPATSVLLHQLGVAADGQNIWLITGPEDEIASGQGVALTRIDLRSGVREDLPAPRAEALAVIGGQTFYSAAGQVHGLGLQSSFFTVGLPTEGEIVMLVSPPVR